MSRWYRVGLSGILDDRHTTTRGRRAFAWVSSASRPVSSLRDLAVIRSVLDAPTVRLDGKPAAATSVYRKPAVFYNALGLAVERRLLPTNPVDLVQWTTPDLAESVGRRVVAGPDQVRGRCAGPDTTKQLSPGGLISGLIRLRSPAFIGIRINEIERVADVNGIQCQGTRGPEQWRTWDLNGGGQQN